MCCNTCNVNVVVPLRMACAFATEMTVYSEFCWNLEHTILIHFERKYVTISRPLSEISDEWVRQIYRGIPVHRHFEAGTVSVEKEEFQYKECDRSGFSPEENFHFITRCGKPPSGTRIDGTRTSAGAIGPSVTRIDGTGWYKSIIPRPAKLATPVVSEEEVLALFAEPSKKKKERTLTAEQEQRRLTREANREKERQKAEKDAFYAKKFGVKFVKAKASSGDIAK